MLFHPFSCIISDISKKYAGAAGENLRSKLDSFNSNPGSLPFLSGIKESLAVTFCSTGREMPLSRSSLVCCTLFNPQTLFAVVD